MRMHMHARSISIIILPRACARSTIYTIHTYMLHYIVSATLRTILLFIYTNELSSTIYCIDWEMKALTTAKLSLVPNPTHPLNSHPIYLHRPSYLCCMYRSFGRSVRHDPILGWRDRPMEGLYSRAFTLNFTLISPALPPLRLYPVHTCAYNPYRPHAVLLWLSISLRAHSPVSMDEIYETVHSIEPE